MKSVSRKAVVVLLSSVLVDILISAPSHAQTAPKRTAQDFNENNNCFVEFEEAEEALRYHFAQRLRLIDINYDGKVSADEIQAYEDTISERVQEELANYKTLSVTVFNRRYFPREIPDLSAVWEQNKFLKHLLIRRSHEDSAISEAKSYKKVQGAIFSYSRDFEDDNSMWQARGALMYPYAIGPVDASPGPGMSATHLMPSITFDRITNEVDKSKEVDSLIPRIGIECEIIDVLFDLQYLRGNAAYATDFDFESGIIAAEFQWEPVHLLAGHGISQPVPILESLLEYRIRTLVHLEYGETLELGNRQNIEEEVFLRLGPKIQAEIFPVPSSLHRVSFHVKFESLEGLSGEPGNSNLIELGMKLLFDRKGHFSLDISYRKGDIPLTMEETDILSIGLGVVF